MNYFRHLTLHRLSANELANLVNLDREFVADVVKNYNSQFYRFPIERVAEIQHLFREANIKVSYRYRGPRRKTYSGSLTCLKQDATHFVVYRR